MRNIYISLIVWFLYNTQIFGNTFFQGENYRFKSMMFLQDTASGNENEFQFETFKNKGSFKSPGKALLYSGFLPGMGQAYMGHWLRGLIFVGLEAAAIGTWYNDNHHNNLAKDKQKEYFYYANEHWDFGRWVHDYYKWKPEDAPVEFSGSQELWNSIREVFVNKTDTLGCLESPYCYTDIWDHGHKVEFIWEGNIVSSSDENIFKPIFKDLCGNKNLGDETCKDSVHIVQSKIDNDDIYVIKDHHFYEGIQKYDMFFAGWDDNDSVEVVIKKHGDINATSPNQKAYRELWNDYNAIKTLAGNGGKFMLINRMVSMVDALLLAKKWNNSHDINLSLNAYPDLRNKSGLGSVKLSFYWQ